MAWAARLHYPSGSNGDTPTFAPHRLQRPHLRSPAQALSKSSPHFRHARVSSRSTIPLYCQGFPAASVRRRRFSERLSSTNDGQNSTSMSESLRSAP